MLPYPM